MAIPSEQNNADIFFGNLSVWDLDQGQVIYAPENETTVVTVITLVASSSGIALSATALALLLLTALLFPEWRQSYKNQVLIQFIIARFIYVLLRYFNNVRNVFGLMAIDDEHFYLRRQMSMSYILMYTEMSFIIWMTIFSKQIYESMVKVFHTHKGSIWKTVLLGWGVPILSAFIFNFAVFFFKNSYVEVHLVYYIFMKWPILFANAGFLYISLRTVLKTNVRVKNNRRITIVMVWLIYVFSIQLLFMDIYRIIHIMLHQRQVRAPPVVQGIYVISNIASLYQFAFSATFWVLGNAKTRQYWRFAPKNERVISQISTRVNNRISTDRKSVV